MKVGPKWRRRLLLSLTGCALAFLIMEVGLRLFVPRNELYAFPFVYQPSALPGVGYTLLPNLDREVYKAHVRSNSFGFRGPEWTRPKPPGILRIALLGDSNSFSLALEERESFPNVLAELLSRDGDPTVEVLNFSLVGYNAEQHEALFRQLVLDFEPDILVLQSCSNDDLPAFEVNARHELVTEDDDGPLERLGMRLRSLSALNAYARSRRFLASMKPRPLLPGVPRDGDGILEPLTAGPPDPELLERVAVPLDALLSEAREQDVRVLLAPFFFEGRWRRLLHDLAERHAAPMVELMGLFPEARSYAEFIDRHAMGFDLHVGAAANRRWAEAVAERIRREGWLTGAEGGRGTHSSVGSESGRGSSGSVPPSPR